MPMFLGITDLELLKSPTIVCLLFPNYVSILSLLCPFILLRLLCPYYVPIIYPHYIPTISLLLPYYVFIMSLLFPSFPYYFFIITLLFAY